ncbi:MAG: trehalase family glycosidase [Calditrichia bacterium]
MQFNILRIGVIIFLLNVIVNLPAQIRISDDYLILNSRADDPLFTTYAAAMERSRFFADKAYFLDYFTPDKPITYTSQYAGEWTILWKVNNIVVDEIGKFIKKPVVVASFPDMAIMKYEPFNGLKVQETFFVYSSGAAIIDLSIKNNGNIDYNFNLYPLVHKPEDSLAVVKYDPANNAYVFTHYESTVRLHSNLYASRGYPTHFRNMLACDLKPDSYGTYEGCSVQDFYFAMKRLSKVHAYVLKLDEQQSGPTEFVALQKNFVLKPGESTHVRFVRGVQDARNDESELANDVQNALKADIQKYVDENVRLFTSIPKIKFKNPKDKMVYLGAYNLVRQSMLPPRGETKYNYYVFSRNPIWGWGHGHQVMHESLSMLPYVYLDSKSAEESQRIYMEQQYPDGLIGYRHGPRGPQVYPHEGKATTSAPFFTWTNWEVYEVSKDKTFLQDAYKSGSKFVEYLEKERDKDHDHMFEWGPYGIIENVRDGWNAVFQLFSEGEDEGRDISDELDDLDLTCQVANEMYYLKLMARELNDAQGAQMWSNKFDEVASQINKYMWDPQDKFYYHVAMSDNSFEFEGESLKRKEIIGFLPMWAHVASKEQAKELVKHLTDETSFWRTYGVPTLAANDPNYTPFVDGCCRWNGPIWLLWDYMVLDGLQNYGYNKLAKQLSDKMMLAVGTQLERNHHFWESYSPDFPYQESPSNYIWDSIMAKVLIDVYQK